MASITISPVYSSFAATSDITGKEKIFIINQNGKPSTIEVNQILDKIDNEIVDRIDDQVFDQIIENVDTKIDDRLDEAIDNVGKLTWNEV